jgi:uncharacterized Zn finger protein
MSGRDRYSRFAPYVPVAERRRKAEAKAKQMAKSGRVLSPVRITGRQIATTFWGRQWCANLGTYSDYSNRLPRGRTYAGNGSIIDLQIAEGKVSALVMGSSLYKIEIVISGLPAANWTQFKERCADRISSLLDLLQGRLDKSVLEEITRRPGGLFPGPREMKFSCSCPDGALMCKHVAATLYGVGARLDTSPELFFTLRSTDMQELISAAGANAAVAPAGPSSGDLDEDDLSALFGIEIEAAPAPKKSTKAAKKTPPKKTPAKKAPAKKTPPKKTPGKKAPSKKQAAADKSKASPKKGAPSKKARASAPAASPLHRPSRS